MRPLIYTPRVGRGRAMTYALTRARDAAVDAACCATLGADLRAGGLAMAGTFVFFMVLGVM